MDRQQNEQKKKDKGTNNDLQNITQKTADCIYWVWFFIDIQNYKNIDVNSF
jgi:hypothetical protein